MKNAIILSILLFSAQFAVADTANPNSDCHVMVSQLELIHGCIFTEGSGPGPCESWESHGPEFDAPLIRTSANHYEINNAEFGLSVNVVFDGEDRAKISIHAPHVSQTETVGVTYENFDTAKRFPKSSSQARFRDLPRQLALGYDVMCSFGLSDAVASDEATETAEMNKLGPAPEWPEPTAPSVQDLPVGTVFELTKDMGIRPGSNTALTRFVEQNGLMTEAGFDALKLPYRFAFADFFNANNLYIIQTHYPKGMRLEVTKVEMTTFDTGGHEFELTLKLVGLPAGYTAAVDPIVRMKVTGRRSGAADIKIPQLAALLSPVMSLKLPK